MLHMYMCVCLYIYRVGNVTAYRAVSGRLAVEILHRLRLCRRLIWCLSITSLGAVRTERSRCLQSISGYIIWDIYIYASSRLSLSLSLWAILCCHGTLPIYIYIYTYISHNGDAQQSHTYSCEPQRLYIYIYIYIYIYFRTSGLLNFRTSGLPNFRTSVPVGVAIALPSPHEGMRRSPPYSRVDEADWRSGWMKRSPSLYLYLSLSLSLSLSLYIYIYITLYIYIHMQI